MPCNPSRLGVWSFYLALALAACGGSTENNESSPTSQLGSPRDEIDDFNPHPDSDGDGTPDTGTDCKAVDILFVIDNSPSMKPYQEGLAAAFPGFVDAMYEVMPPDVDLHVGITTTSFYSGSCGEGHVNCQTTASPAEVEAHYVTPMAGSTGTNGEQGRLFEWQNARYMTANTSDADSSALKTWFSGAAVAAGESGCSFEMSAAGASYAVHPANAPHNAGFVRDENAVLVLFVLSDEPDKSPEGTATYLDIVRSAKSACGGDSCIRTGGLVTPCVMAGQNALYDFLNGFGSTANLGNIEDPSKYTEVVGESLAKAIRETCATLHVPK